MTAGVVAGVLSLVSYKWSPQPTECRTWPDVSPPTQLEDDLLHPNPALEKKKHKLKRLVQSPNSYFMDVKCPGEPPPRSCWNIPRDLRHSCMEVA